MLPEDEFVEMVRRCFTYHEDGYLIWRWHPDPKARSRWVGRRFGSIDTHSYREGYFLGAKWFEHHLIYAWHHGKRVPWDMQIDHIDRDRANNRIQNLRLVSSAQNGKNRSLRCDNYSGVRGVSRYRGRWQANITVDGQQIYLGWFTDLAEARTARLRAEALYFGEFASEEAKALARRRF